MSDSRRLRTSVHLRDDAGRRHVFMPGDVLPGWAARKVGDHVFDDYVDPASPNLRDQRPEYGDDNAVFDVICPLRPADLERGTAAHGSILIARFERVVDGVHVADGRPLVEHWVWNGARALNGGRRWDGPDDPGRDVQPERIAIQTFPDGTRRARLYCPGCRTNLTTRKVDRLFALFDELTAQGVASVHLPVLAATFQ